jgi:hypothetical protein
MKGFNIRSIWICAMIICILALGSTAIADESTVGRDLTTKYGNAVVKIMLVVKMSMSFQGQGDSREQKSEVTGTVIDPSGLTVVSLTAVNPGDMLGGMFGGDEGPSISTEVKDVKIRLVDGKEIPGKVVLRDKDLDLAFIRPVTKPTAPMAYIDLKNSGNVDMLDQTVLVSRLGKVANRSIAAYMQRIQAVVEKPRKFYTVGLSGRGDELGAPVFTMDGKVVGLLLLRVMQGQASGMSDSPFLPVIIPADEIQTVAVQAPEDAPKEEVKPAAPAKDTSKEPAKPKK